MSFFFFFSLRWLSFCFLGQRDDWAWKSIQKKNILERNLLWQNFRCSSGDLVFANYTIKKQSIRKYDLNSSNQTTLPNCYKRVDRQMLQSQSFHFFGPAESLSFLSWQEQLHFSIIQGTKKKETIKELRIKIRKQRIKPKKGQMLLIPFSSHAIPPLSCDVQCCIFEFHTHCH